MTNDDEFRPLTAAEMATMRYDPSPEQTRLVMRAIARMWNGSGGDPVRPARRRRGAR